MFKIIDEPTFTHPVEVLVPTDGGHEKQTFKATFRVVSTDQSAEYDLNTAAGSAEFLKIALVSMDELLGADDKPMPYNDALRDRLLAVPYVRVALGRTYFAAITKAAVGN